MQISFNAFRWIFFSKYLKRVPILFCTYSKHSSVLLRKLNVFEYFVYGNIQFLLVRQPSEIENPLTTFYSLFRKVQALEPKKKFLLNMLGFYAKISPKILKCSINIADLWKKNYFRTHFHTSINLTESLSYELLQSKFFINLRPFTGLSANTYLLVTVWFDGYEGFWIISLLVVTFFLHYC